MIDSDCARMVDSDVAALHEQLGEAAFAEAWAAGQAMTPEQTIAYALDATAD